eukprot:gene17827-biopygen26793
MHFAKIEDLRDNFSDWLEQASLLAPPPEAEEGFLQWWPRFKSQVAGKARSLNRLTAARHQSYSAEVSLAQINLATSISLVEDRNASALPQVITHRQTLSLARPGAAVSSAETGRRDWLHAQERPCPLLTKLERPPPASRLVPSLRAPSGGLVTGPSIPNVVGAYWASVSSVPPSAYPDAQEEVMAAHRQASSSLPPSVADEVGSLTVRPGECRIAIRRSPPGKSPGPDGIPIELYRTLADCFTPLLCRLYSAMGTKGLLPPEFLEGSLIILGKGGDKLDAGNYQPITLVNTDYRILAKVLANRLGLVMNRIIYPEQSAFLPCRQIGDAILFLQLLPELLKVQNKSGVLAFLDFRKAYNTLDRAFLFQCLEVAGLGGGFLTWVRLLLSSTATRAMVNGFRSRAFEFLAGVRQGDYQLG